MDICLAHNNRADAQLYVSRVSEDMKVRYYVKLEYVSTFEN